MVDCFYLSHLFMIVEFFDEHVEQFLNSLDTSRRVKISGLIELLGRYGSRMRMPHSKSLGDGLFELRTLGRPQVRVLYCFLPKRIVLLHGFLKDTKRIPHQELAIAKYRKHLLERT